MRDTLTILQQSRLEEIGKYLQQVRLEAHISLADISRKTKINQLYLAAIEKGDLKYLPEPIYIRGFIKLFANTLRLQGEELALTFPLEA
jgi:cytoskeletal protein RodZ